ncbi:YceI family protein [Myceligenerans crystallogenes]|uniref:Lipid/polyisoprenoid-binding YceI-like domain-containing protein n=1 Tax=Myceligenerans crystallogenes TaxID=316335 RepID=A0ABP4ZF55_9MICO
MAGTPDGAGSGAGVAGPRQGKGLRIALIAGIAVVAAVLVVLGVTQLYASMQTGDDVPAPAVGSGDDAPAVTRDLAELDGDWSVADGSEAGYRVDEVLNGTDVTVVGRTSQVTGTVTVSGGELTAADVEVDTASIETDEAARDSQFQGILSTTEYPAATFSATEAVDISAVADGETVAVEVPGTMTITGTSQDVTAEIEVRLTDAGAELAASIPVTFADYGIEAPDLGFVTVEDDGFVEAQLSLAQ